MGWNSALAVVGDFGLDLHVVRIEHVDLGRIARAEDDFRILIFDGVAQIGQAFAFPAERQRLLAQRKGGIVVLESVGAGGRRQDVESLEGEHRSVARLAQQQKSLVVGRGDAQLELRDLGARRAAGLEIAVDVVEQFVALEREVPLGADRFVIDAPFVADRFVFIREFDVGCDFEILVQSEDIVRFDARHLLDVGRHDRLVFGSSEQDTNPGACEAAVRKSRKNLFISVILNWVEHWSDRSGRGQTGHSTSGKVTP